MPLMFGSVTNATPPDQGKPASYASTTNPLRGVPGHPRGLHEPTAVRFRAATQPPLPGCIAMRY